jgi:hypothetical protein
MCYVFHITCFRDVISTYNAIGTHIKARKSYGEKVFIDKWSEKRPNTCYVSHTVARLMYTCPTTRHEGTWRRRDIAPTRYLPWH